MREALNEWPVRFLDNPAHIGADGTCRNRAIIDGCPPEVSFIIGHRGPERLPHLLLTLSSIAAQQDVPFECIVVEQDLSSRIQKYLPGWVRYVHTPFTDPDMAYCRSWAFNVASGLARSKLLIFHDNDMLVPSSYAVEVLRIFQKGYEVINLKRFVFYLARSESDIRSRLENGETLVVDHVVENLEAGGSVALAREAYDAIGGFDEDFIGWGGEDNEFWDRCLTRNVWNYAFLPIVHLWHEGQPGKRAVNGLGAQTAELSVKRRAINPMTRIDDLKLQQQGLPLWNIAQENPATTATDIGRRAFPPVSS
jgi:hypothetical protein